MSIDSVVSINRQAGVKIGGFLDGAMRFVTRLDKIDPEMIIVAFTYGRRHPIWSSRLVKPGQIKIRPSATARNGLGFRPAFCGTVEFVRAA